MPFAFHVSASHRGLAHFTERLDVVIVVVIKRVPFLLSHVFCDVDPPFDVGLVFGGVEMAAACPALFVAWNALVVSVLL